MARRSLWRRLRRATRDPRNAALARAIGGFGRALGALPMPVALAVGRGLGTAAHALLAAPRRLAVAHMGLAFPERELATGRRPGSRSWCATIRASSPRWATRFAETASSPC